MSKPRLLQLWLFLLHCSAYVWSVSGQPCILTVPADPLTATGLATPYLVTGCVQDSLGNGGTATFVQATIVDLDTGNLYAYTPLVLAAAAPNNVAAIMPVTPVLPANSVVGLWFGTNGGSTTLAATLTGNLNSLVQGNCVNGGGTPFSIFGQFAACNGAAFFNAVYALVNKGLITKVVVAAGVALKANQVPELGVDVLGDTCPTTHSFSIVDQDQSDNTDAKYLIVTGAGTLAVDTVKNRATLTAGGMPFTGIDNGSDELLITLVQTAVGCQPYVIMDLGDDTGQTKSPTLATNQLQAIISSKGTPRAFLPANDPMAVNGNGVPDINKLNAYRTAVGQSSLTTVNDASTAIYCNNMYVMGAPAIAKWLPLLVNVPAPDFGVGISNTLGGVLVGRYGAAINSPANGGVLNCPGLIGLPNPFAAFTGVGAGGALVCPAPFTATTCQLSTTAQTIPQLLGVQNLAANQNGQLTVDIPAGLTMAANGELGPTAGTVTVTTTTTTNNNFNVINFVEGAAAVAGLVLVAGLVFYCCARSKGLVGAKSTPTSNFSMTRF